MAGTGSYGRPSDPAWILSAPPKVTTGQNAWWIPTSPSYDNRGSRPLYPALAALPRYSPSTTVAMPPLATTKVGAGDHPRRFDADDSARSALVVLGIVAVLGTTADELATADVAERGGSTPVGAAFAKKATVPTKVVMASSQAPGRTRCL